MSDPSSQAASDVETHGGAPDPPLHQALGLTDEEFAQIGDLLGRQPNHLELAMYSVMWSEHCSYKSSRVHLGRFPTEAPWVLVGPGENAGVVDVGDDIAVALRIESHNHPSAIEPYQGAATGIGGIVRDIFTMGARPIALMDPLRFGPLDDARSRWIAEGVVSGVSGYGNSVGIPTVGGEVVFDETFTENPLVNVFCLGIMPTERLVLAKASGEGNLAVLLGNSTGRDGIGGVSVLASAEFADGDEAKRPSVQVGDPFEEKRLIEATLALLDAGLVVGIQDLGGAGLTCATSETASNANMGMDVDVSMVPQREPNMSPVEVLTSESQERMLAIVEPHRLDDVLAITDAWEVQASAIGVVTDGGVLRVFDQAGGEVLAEVPAATLHEDAPLYRRPLAPPEDLEERWASEPGDGLSGGSDSVDQGAALLAMMMDTSWVYSQYDHQLFLNTVVGPGSDATVLRLRDPRTGADTGRGLGLSADGNHRWCASDPERGAAMVVCESVMNLAAVGARPLALVNCLNFGNPEHPEVMWQLSGAIDGMSAACREFNLPVVGGNVSLYNSSGGRDIDPTPVVTTLGMIDDLTAVPPGMALTEGATVVVLGSFVEGLAGSRWAWDQGLKGGRVPDPDLASVVDVAELSRSLVAESLVLAAHDVSEGGLALALAEMALAGEVGLEVSAGADTPLADTAGGWFGESAGRMVVAVASEHLNDVLDRAETVGIATVVLGESGGSNLRLGTTVTVDLDALRDNWRDRLPGALSSGNLAE
ncbi:MULTISPECIES: phosphoribosylformylglycinamidine synthase subunit PurL [Candidatus Neomicrothrix]|uniref:Phosphoribosylformylglycinamidine synthase subunit PurL n=1 Tax=Candidatus Neomicrothrix parvicella RN1 TaxID=1229780 RepID=R4YZJ1_9ACTN|nr:MULTISPECIES: phosphoribosylformylglycinamidine synthase subunit PurL [Microthrix]MBK6501770.1 phosphoribosylformylglycinamidine synthase subunit PurL [Candidatus Microthrix sp.]MBK7018949.1 phosphoribosylformylglycinamidine synthase subunit PurL [Candidatus Microthrix sp.]MBL0203313.1 phosphoribosylformylglycinamidine synthase subunit PurL [Candidatus Microthrix sp.]MBP6133512.1 phosphoribosylformylglycinamidine synthase subunit PurL [Candidatus Microthrix sp.]MBP6151062.1 phosphoribosylfo